MIFGLLSMYVLTAIGFFASVIRTAVEMKEIASPAAPATGPVLELVDGGAAPESVRKAA